MNHKPGDLVLNTESLTRYCTNSEGENFLAIVVVIVMLIVIMIVMAIIRLLVLKRITTRTLSP